MNKDEAIYISEQIKSIVNVSNLLDKFNIEQRHKRCRCFVHNGKDFNVKVFDNGIYCFVCGAKLDAIGIVKHFHNCEWIDAAKYLSDMYSLGLFNDMTPQERRERDKRLREDKARREAERERKEYADYAYRRLCDYLHWLNKQPTTHLTVSHAGWCNRLLDRLFDNSMVIDFDIDDRLAGMWQQHKIKSN